MQLALAFEIDLLAALRAIGEVADEERELLFVLAFGCGGRGHSKNRSKFQDGQARSLSYGSSPPFSIAFNRLMARRYRMLAAGSVNSRAWAISWFESCSKCRMMMISQS